MTIIEGMGRQPPPQESWEGRKYKITSTELCWTSEEADWHKQSNSKRGPRCIMPITRRFDATEFLISRVMGQLSMLILSLKSSTFCRWDRIHLWRLHWISSHRNHSFWSIKIFEKKIQSNPCVIFYQRQNLIFIVKDLAVYSWIKVYLTCQQDRRVKFLAGQDAILARHCPLTGRYFEPCPAKK